MSDTATVCTVCGRAVYVLDVDKQGRCVVCAPPVKEKDHARPAAE